MKINDNDLIDDHAQELEGGDGLNDGQTLGIDREEQQLRKKKIFIALPFIIIPCVLFGFWMVKGSGDANAVDLGSVVAHNANTELPDPIVSPSRSKREAYEEADKEADLRDYNLKNDPNADRLSDDGDRRENNFEQRLNERTDKLSSQLNSFNNRISDIDQTDVALRSSPNAAQTKQRGGSSPRASSYSPRITQMAKQEDEKIAEFEAKMAKLNSYGSAPGESPSDPLGDLGEDENLSPEDSLAAVQLAALDRIMGTAKMLRFPELAEEELRQMSLENGKTAYPISQTSVSDREVRYFGIERQVDSLPRPRGGFYTNEEDQDRFEQITVGAQVHSSVTVLEGSTVKLRLLDDIFVAGLRIPQHSFVYGTTSLGGDRLRIEVNSINFRGNIYQVKLEAYDLDGLPGIAVPGSVERQIAKREAAQSARSIGGNNRSGGNLATQLAAEGTDVVRDIASRKVATTKVHLKASHRVILRNQQ